MRVIAGIGQHRGRRFALRCRRLPILAKDAFSGIFADMIVESAETRLAVSATTTFGYDPAQSPRDLRLDLLKGMAMVGIVVTHTGSDSFYSRFSYHSLGFVTGAEIFLIASGFILGQLHRRRIETEGLAAS